MDFLYSIVQFHYTINHFQSLKMCTKKRNADHSQSTFLFLFLILFQDYLFHCHGTCRLGTINLHTGTRHPYQVTAASPTAGILSTKGNRSPMQ